MRRWAIFKYGGASRLRGLVHVYPRKSAQSENTRCWPSHYPPPPTSTHRRDSSVILTPFFQFPTSSFLTTFWKVSRVVNARPVISSEKNNISLRNISNSTIAIFIYTPFLSHRLSSIRAHVYIRHTETPYERVYMYTECFRVTVFFFKQARIWIIFLSKKHHHQSCSMSLHCSHLRVHSFISTVHGLRGMGHTLVILVTNGNSEARPVCYVTCAQGGKKARMERPRRWRTAADVALLQNTLINDSSEQIYLHY